MKFWIYFIYKCDVLWASVLGNIYISVVTLAESLLDYQKSFSLLSHEWFMYQKLNNVVVVDKNKTQKLKNTQRKDVWFSVFSVLLLNKF